MSFLTQTSRVVARQIATRGFSSTRAAANLTYQDVLNAPDMATAEAHFAQIKADLQNYDAGREAILGSNGKVDLDAIPKFAEKVQEDILAANNVDTSSFSPEVLSEFNKLRQAVQETYRKIENFSPGAFQPIDWEKMEKDAPSPSVFQEFKDIMNNFELPEIKIDVDPLINYFEKNNADLKAFAEQSQKRMEELGFTGDRDIDPRFLLELGETKEEIAAELGLNPDDPMFLEEYAKASEMGKNPLLDEERAAAGDIECINYLNDEIAKTLGVKVKPGEHATVEDVLEAFPQWETEIYDDIKRDAWSEDSAAEEYGESFTKPEDEAPQKPQWLSHVSLPSEKKE